MSIKKTVQTTRDKILNSDIYDLTAFVDDIKKDNIDGLDGNKETLLVGMYGYLGYEFTSLLQNSIVTASELSNEAIPTRAKFDRNVITHALSLGVKKVSATPANMKVLMLFPEKALRANMIDNKFVFKSTTPIFFDSYEFHTDYDIEINLSILSSSTIGSTNKYIYTAEYKMDTENPISTIENPYLPPISIFNYVTENMVVLVTNLHQVEYTEIEEKIINTDYIANKVISFSFENQMSHFYVEVREPKQNGDTENNIVELIPVYDGLYNQEIASKKYCYYQYINSNTIRIRFDPNSYQPEANSDVIIKLYTTSGEAGNFKYSEDLTVRLTSDEYTNLYTIIKQRGEDGSVDGLDRKTVEELQRIIPKEALSRGSITTLKDLKNYFNSINNENSVLHVFRKEDNILTRIYYTYCLMKDSDNNIIPTNTIPVFLESKLADKTNGKIYLESGTPVYYYKYGDGANIELIKNNYIGYLQEKLKISNDFYTFLDDKGMSFFYGKPSDDSLEKWAKEYPNSFDPSNEIEGFELIEKPSKVYYKFESNTPVYFKMLYIGNTTVDSKYYDEYYYGITDKFNIIRREIGIESLSMDDYDIYYMKKNGTIVINPINEFGKLDVPDRKNIISIKRFRISDESEAIFECPLVKNSNGEVTSIYVYTASAKIDFYDKNKEFYKLMYSSGASDRTNATLNYLIPGYFEDLSELRDEDKINYVNFLYRTIPGISIDCPVVLESIMTINAYSYNGQGDYSFSKLTLTEGDLIRFLTYKAYSNGKYLYTDPNTWKLGEIISIEKRDGVIISLELLVQDTEAGCFVENRYRLPIAGIDDNASLGKYLSDGSNGTITDIISIYKITKFLYTSPLNIVLADDPTINSHRITASYYLDIINETRYTDFKCINSNSPIQYIMSSIHVKRTSYLSDNRYQYTISMNITPNIGEVTNAMINRTQVVGVFYKDGVPKMYSIAKYVGTYGDNLESMPYEIKLYTIPFGSSDTFGADIVNSEHCIYIGKDQYIKELKESGLSREEMNQEFFDNYNLFTTNANYERSLEMPVDFDFENPNMFYKTSRYVDSMYLDFNTEFRVYILYKYDGNNKPYYDGLSDEYMYKNKTGLTSNVPKETEFKSLISKEEDEESFVQNYRLKDMTLTNVYNTIDGINLLYDYSNIMNSYVTSLSTNSLFDETVTGNNKSHIVNRVPMVRYFYFNTEERVLTFIQEMKRKINYVLDAIDPLECTFGLDFKFFNTYGPSNMYHITDDDGDVTDLIDDVALTVTFRTKFYNNDDAPQITQQIKDYIKTYLEKLDSLDDIHFPNITTEIEKEFGEFIIYFEFVSFNIYDANHQHIITNENMEMLTVVPEFLHIDTDDYNGLPYINIRVVD